MDKDQVAFEPTSPMNLEKLTVLNNVPEFNSVRPEELQLMVSDSIAV
jgi:hypothetical protein